MSRPVSSALHPLSFEFSKRLSGSKSRAQQLREWQRNMGADVAPPPARLVAEHPLVASVALQIEIERHAAELIAFLAVQRNELLAAQPAWPGLTAPDVVCADLAVVADAEAPTGWALRWVEFQAFTSIVSTMHTLHQGATKLWPEARELRHYRLASQDADWMSAVRGWAAPHGGILLEQSPTAQGTRFDIEAAAHLFGLPIVEPNQLFRRSSALAYAGADGMRRPVSHVFNRLVMHELPNRSRFEREAAEVDVTWHSHPAWYYGISKSLLTRLPQGAGAAAAQATNWRALGLPANALVAKNVNSHGGAAVHLHVTEQFLDNLENPEAWLVQPRYTPQALFVATDGAPIYGEIRCVIANPCSSAPWVPCQFMRLSRSAKVSAAGLVELPGNGLAVLYRPPGS